MSRRSTLALLIVVLLEIGAVSAAGSFADEDDQRRSDYQYCGQPSPPSHQRVRRVIGGTDAAAHAWPWQVLILNGSSLYCSGSIISPTWILTSAHCLDKTYNTLVYVGRHGVNEKDTHEQKLQVKEHSIHPNYIRGDLVKTGDNDMALIQLKRPIQFTPFVHAVCLPDKHTHFRAGHECTLSGWGVTNVTTKATADTLRQVRLPLVAQKVCNSNESYGGRINKRYFCAGVPEGGKDGCTYDSGGPLVCSNDPNAWYLTGMVSWGDGCAKPKKYGVFLNITEMMTFIRSKVKDLPQPYRPTPKMRSTAKNDDNNKTTDNQRKERLFIAIICALAVIIVILLITLIAVKYYTKGYVCCTKVDDTTTHRQMPKSKLIASNDARNREVDV